MPRSRLPLLPPLRPFLALLVPGFDVSLADDLAVLQLKRRRGEHFEPIRVLASLVERDTVLTDDLVLDVMGHRPPANVTQQLGDLLLATKHHRRARRRVLVDHAELGIVGVEGYERVVVALLYGVAHRLEVEAGGHLFGHTLSNLL